jgi:hypothetical protein
MIASQPLVSTSNTQFPQVLFCYLDLILDTSSNSISDFKVNKIISKGKNSKNQHILGCETINEEIDMTYLNIFKVTKNDGDVFFKVRPE